MSYPHRGSVYPEPVTKQPYPSAPYGGYPQHPHQAGGMYGHYPPMQQQMQQPMPNAPPSNSNVTNVNVQMAPTVQQRELRENHKTFVSDDKYIVDLCDCFHSCKYCVLVYFCPQIAMCIAANKINENCCYPFCCYPDGIVVVSARYRTMNRIQLGLCQEHMLWCCPFTSPCMLCRTLNDMEEREHMTMTRRF